MRLVGRALVLALGWAIIAAAAVNMFFVIRNTLPHARRSLQSLGLFELGNTLSALQRHKDEPQLRNVPFPVPEEPSEPTAPSPMATPTTDPDGTFVPTGDTAVPTPIDPDSPIAAPTEEETEAPVAPFAPVAPTGEEPTIVDSTTTSDAVTTTSDGGEATTTEGEATTTSDGGEATTTSAAVDCSDEYDAFSQCTADNNAVCGECDPSPPGDLAEGADCELFDPWFNGNFECCTADECGESFDTLEECKNCPFTPVAPFAPTGESAAPAVAPVTTTTVDSETTTTTTADGGGSEPSAAPVDNGESPAPVPPIASPIAEPTPVPPIASPIAEPTPIPPIASPIAAPTTPVVSKVSVRWMMHM
jgi:hypothetical protein